MTIRDDVDKAISNTVNTEWEIRDGQVVPSSIDVQLNNHGVRLDATILYVDLAGSTKIVQGFRDWFAATIFSGFLEGSVRIIRHFDGAISSFDGDRVMGVFIGGSKNSNAVRAALKINYMVTEILQKKIKARWSDQQSVQALDLRHCAGIDTGTVLAARAGIRGSNDLIWVGKPANRAALLSDMRSGPRTFITKDVYLKLSEDAKFAEGTDMWNPIRVRLKDDYVSCYSSTYHWAI